MDALDQIFSKHSNRNIIMKWTDKDFDSLMNDLFEYFQNEDDVAEFMSSGEVDSYLNKYNIELIEPEEFSIDLDLDAIPHQKSGNDVPMNAAMEEIRRMQELAGLLEEKEEKTEVLSPGLAFKEEKLRDMAAKWLSNPQNYPTKNKGKQLQRPPVKFEMKDSTGIRFSTQENKVKPESLKKLVEILRKKMPAEWGAETTEYKND